MGSWLYKGINLHSQICSHENWLLDCMFCSLNLIANRSATSANDLKNVINLMWHLKYINVLNNGKWRQRFSSLSQRVWCSDNEQEFSSSRLIRRGKEERRIGSLFLVHFQEVILLLLLLPSFPFRAHHTLNSNTCCCNALISSYMLYANRV